MTDFMYFLGRFHVLVLHLPIGILLLAVLLEILVRRPAFKSLEVGMPVVWLVGAISAVFTVALGYMHAAEGGFDAHAINLHRWSATLLALLAFVIWAWRSEAPLSYAKSWPIAMLGVVGLLFATGHFGGNLTHGSTYLLAYAPAPLQRLAGLPEEQIRRPQVTKVVAADIYLDVVAPALRNRCITCHNDSKRSGSLSLAGYPQILKGGKDGAVVVPGDAKKSDLYRRISLPHESGDFMPKEGKTPLTAQETSAIEWWISVGAPKQGTLAALKAPVEVQSTVGGILGIPAVAATTSKPASSGAGQP